MNRRVALLCASVMGAANVHAAPLDTSPLPSNAYIVVDGYDVAWADPCSWGPPSCSTLDLSGQGQYGWQVLSSGLYAQLGISANSFFFAGANAQYNAASGSYVDPVSGAFLTSYGAGGFNPPTTDVAIASPWFNDSFSNADYSDGASGQWSFSDVKGFATYDTLVFRVDPGSTNSAPEPDTFALIGIAIAGLCCLVARRRGGVRPRAG